MHTNEGIAWLINSNTNDATSKFVAETLWPGTFRFKGKAIKNAEGTFEIKHGDNAARPPVLDLSKNNYVLLTTFFWGFKLVWNIFLYALFMFINIVTWIELIGWFFLKFLHLVFLAPFGL